MVYMVKLWYTVYGQVLFLKLKILASIPNFDIDTKGKNCHIDIFNIIS